MALPTANLVQDALEVIYSVISEDKTKAGARSAAQALNELRVFLTTQYPVVDIVITADADDAGVSEFIAAESTMAVGVVLRKQGTASFDLLDDAFATAKGTALAAGDIFVLDGADSVKYLGNGGNTAFDMSGETTQDFVSYGA
jgi:hypothetical protein